MDRQDKVRDKEETSKKIKGNKAFFYCQPEFTFISDVGVLSANSTGNNLSTAKINFKINNLGRSLQSPYCQYQYLCPSFFLPTYMQVWDLCVTEMGAELHWLLGLTLMTNVTILE